MMTSKRIIIDIRDILVLMLSDRQVPLVSTRHTHQIFNGVCKMIAYDTYTARDVIMGLDVQPYDDPDMLLLTQTIPVVFARTLILFNELGVTPVTIINTEIRGSDLTLTYN